MSSGTPEASSSIKFAQDFPDDGEANRGNEAEGLLLNTQLDAEDNEDEEVVDIYGDEDTGSEDEEVVPKGPVHAETSRILKTKGQSQRPEKDNHPTGKMVFMAPTGTIRLRLSEFTFKQNTEEF